MASCKNMNILLKYDQTVLMGMFKDTDTTVSISFECRIFWSLPFCPYQIQFENISLFMLLLHIYIYLHACIWSEYAHWNYSELERRSESTVNFSTILKSATVN